MTEADFPPHPCTGPLCPLCGAFRRVAGLDEPPPPAPCVHYVDAPKVRVAGSVRDWRECPKGHGTVCPCVNCGPKCPDYAAG